MYSSPSLATVQEQCFSSLESLPHSLKQSYSDRRTNSATGCIVHCEWRVHHSSVLGLSRAGRCYQVRQDYRPRWLVRNTPGGRCSLSNDWPDDTSCVCSTQATILVEWSLIPEPIDRIVICAVAEGTSLKSCFRTSDSHLAMCLASYS